MDAQLNTPSVALHGTIGRCGGREVFLGFAPASLLKKLSFADVLIERSGTGYQRPICVDHSLAFKRYIQEPGATTIPLTFNLRESDPPRWRVERHATHGFATLMLDPMGPPTMAQVDCQHRLGYLSESPESSTYRVSAEWGSLRTDSILHSDFEN